VTEKGLGPRPRKPATLRPKAAQTALAADPLFGPWVTRIGPPRFSRVTDEPFPYLVRAIVYQQLAGAAAATIHGRFVRALSGTVTPRAVLRAREEDLRAAGLSRGKLAAIRDLAEKETSLELQALAALQDEEVQRRLVTVRGIGPWTAQMFLMFFLRRADVWPAGDLGVRSGYARIHRLGQAPTEKEILPLGDRYRPWRSAAAWYCWRALEVEPVET
jgi:DNA-3-methyladenine glycosylase II